MATLPNSIILPTLKCSRCGHKWHPAKPLVPKRCGRCKSPYWDRPRVYKLKTDEARDKPVPLATRKSNSR